MLASMKRRSLGRLISLASKGTGTRVTALLRGHKCIVTTPTGINEPGKDGPPSSWSAREAKMKDVIRPINSALVTQQATKLGGQASRL